MTYSKEVGEVKNLSYEIKQFEWSIPDFFTVTDDPKYSCYDSPTFSIADTSLRLSLRPNWKSWSRCMQLNLCYDMEQECLLEYNYELKKCDGSMEQLRSGELKGVELCCTEETILIQRSVILRRKSELVPGNVLTIVLTAKLMTEMTHSSEQTSLDAARRLTLINSFNIIQYQRWGIGSCGGHKLYYSKKLERKNRRNMLIKLDKLSENFKDLFGDKETCDTTLKVKDREFKVHRSVLIARSSVFAATFRHDTLEKQTGIINIPDCDPDYFLEFLKYLYCGKLEGLSLHSALNLYYTSEKYDVEELKKFCLESLMQSLTVDNVCEVAAFADENEEVALFSAVQDLFNKNVDNILVTSEWDNLLVKDRHLANKLLIAMPKVKCCDRVSKSDFTFYLEQCFSTIFRPRHFEAHN